MNNILKVDQKQCYSCRSCEQSCPKHAISMVENKEGFFYPVVNDSCIDCGICLSRCPSHMEISDSTYKQKINIAYLKDQKKIMDSSSGGLFAAIAEYIIDNGGVTFGAVFDEKLKLSQKIARNYDELKKQKGSKYLESSTGDSFSKTKQCLDEGLVVLYSGTPCQIAGLKHFLKKDYDNLLTIDLICHGVPSQKLFDKYITWLENRWNEKIIYYGFRDKDMCGWSHIGKAKTKSKVHRIDGACDPYYSSFSRCETYRESCYTCKFASLKRPADLTIGDFYEIQKVNPTLMNDNGVSICLINSSKGETYFSQIASKLNLLSIKVDGVLEDKQNLFRPYERADKRDFVYQNIDALPNNVFFSQFPESSIVFRFKYMLKLKILKLFPRSLKDFVKGILKK
ncbi:Coenzyme F420 hydrogenase/dehydrogenase, beta subunit C-terminal domain [Hallerella porci]|uniref:Coenzyme F420-reducing hydrogenase beta subunit n=1 Tax=Hallerella porci TaxID=1945871 RepID=A0ABX5LJI5_9BACT|nr:Coenzyme F420 hydrogenase/dehydrogenase, beta subunit C-terminal domain [Hallerella porci]PWK92656.1 coenzyme F420-reducing hydrogenase beta subunit [Hallerella porci]